MSEINSRTSSEIYSTSRVEALELTSEAELDFHKSNLPSAEEGREKARLARIEIETAIREMQALSPEQLARQASIELSRVGQAVRSMRNAEINPHDFDLTEKGFDDAPNPLFNEDQFGAIGQYEATSARR